MTPTAGEQKNAQDYWQYRKAGGCLTEEGHAVPNPHLLGRYERRPHSLLWRLCCRCAGHCGKNQLPRPKNRNSGFQRFAKNDTAESFKSAVGILYCQQPTDGDWCVLPVKNANTTSGVWHCAGFFFRAGYLWVLHKKSVYQHEILIILLCISMILHAVEISALTKCDAHVTLNLTKVHKNGCVSKA